MFKGNAMAALRVKHTQKRKKPFACMSPFGGAFQQQTPAFKNIGKTYSNHYRTFKGPAIGKQCMKLSANLIPVQKNIKQPLGKYAQSF